MGRSGPREGYLLVAVWCPKGHMHRIGCCVADKAHGFRFKLATTASEAEGILRRWYKDGWYHTETKRYKGPPEMFGD